MEEKGRLQSTDSGLFDERKARNDEVLW